MRKLKIAILILIAFQVGEVTMNVRHMRNFDSRKLDKKRSWKIVMAYLRYTVKRDWDNNWQLSENIFAPKK